MLRTPATSSNAASTDLPRGLATPTGPRQDSDRRTRPLALTLTLVGVATMGFNTTRLGGWTLSDWSFMAAVGAALAEILSGRGRGLAPPSGRRGASPVLAGVFLLLTSATLSSLWSLDAFASMTVVLRIAWVTLVWFWLLRSVARDLDALGEILTAFRITLLLSVAAAIIGYVGLMDFNGDALQAGWNYGRRQTAFFGHPNHLAALLVMGFPFVLLDVPGSFTRRSDRSGVMRMVLIAAVLFALAATGSMSGLIALVASLGAMGIVRARTAPRRRSPLPRNPLVLVLLIACAAAAALAFVRSDSPVVERLTAWTEGEAHTSASVGSRGDFNQFVLDRMDERLVLGVGLDEDSSHFEDSGSAPGHNLFLKFVHSAGVPALAGLLIVILVSLHQAWRLAGFAAGTALDGLTIALTGSIVAAVVIAQFHPGAYERYFWFPLALTDAVRSLSRRTRIPLGTARS